MSEIVERKEYNRDTNPYPSFGKKYNSERAVISLTSWKARINTVSKTLYSLLTQCKGFHIVLVLSEEEFPKMMDELPENLKLFVDNELIEVLWVYKNYKSFKKVLFTMDKYRHVPIISADDDCIYLFNYAEELYQKYLKYNCMVTETTEGNGGNAFGYATIYPASFIIVDKKILSAITQILKKSSHDDFFMRFIRERKKVKLISLHREINRVAMFINNNQPLSKTRFYTEGSFIKNIINKTLCLN